METRRRVQCLVLLLYGRKKKLDDAPIGFEGKRQLRQFITGPQALRGCDYSHGGLYIEMCFEE